MLKIFIDGHAGTTGLQIHERLQNRGEIQLLSIPDQDRKNKAVKKKLFSEADLIILCLPDHAAIASVELAGNTRILDASTAYRTHQDWIYGLPELDPGQRDLITNARLVSNPGCYPTGFLLAIAPLIALGQLRPDVQLSISAVSGYTGGGRQLIEKFQSANVREGRWSSRPYALKFGHKHVPEMKKYAGLSEAPLFMPSVGNYPQGMLVSIPLTQSFFEANTSLDDIYSLLSERYSDEPCVLVHQPNSNDHLTDGFLDPQDNNNTNRNDIHIFGNDEQFMLVSQLDNLGKGAAGAAIQNLNIMLGINELDGLHVEMMNR
ncbi:MAG: N-acetyl-gamma-glutamyl-phosphate reductase [Pseudomonadales bacterium]|nr:N-acetyl-gamma-glutamyl-phosphate reductase [Pseudomonadales bacterium]